MKPVKLQPRKRLYRTEVITKLKNMLEGFSSRLDELKDKKKKGDSDHQGQNSLKKIKDTLKAQWGHQAGQQSHDRVPRMKRERG